MKLIFLRVWTFQSQNGVKQIYGQERKIRLNPWTDALWRFDGRKWKYQKVMWNFIKRVIGAFFHPDWVSSVERETFKNVCFCPFYQFTW